MHILDRALKGGVKIKDVFDTVQAVADAGAAALVMTYWNPVDKYGADAFSRDLASAGGAGRFFVAVLRGFTLSWKSACAAPARPPSAGARRVRLLLSCRAPFPSGGPLAFALRRFL